MSSKDRGMMKWAPYKSLIEQEDALTRAKINLEKCPKPQLTEDLIEEINNILVNYHNQQVRVTYWVNGFIRFQEGLITKIDSQNHHLIINRLTINFNDLTNLEEI